MDDKNVDKITIIVMNESVIFFKMEKIAHMAIYMAIIQPTMWTNFIDILIYSPGFSLEHFGRHIHPSRL